MSQPTQEQDVHPLVRRFTTHILDARRLSKSTAKCYKWDLSQLVDFFSSRNGVSVEQAILAADTPILREFIEGLKQMEYSVVTICRKIAALKSFYKWLVKENLVASNPMVPIMQQQPKSRPLTIDREGAKQICLAPSGDDLMGRRDRALLELMYSSGLMVSEIVRLNRADVQDGLKVVMASKSPQTTMRAVPLSDDAADALRIYVITLRRVVPLMNEEGAPLFVNNHGTRLSTRSVRRKVKKYVRKVGADANINPRTLRNSFATHMLANGVSVEKLQSIMGHLCPSTTMKHHQPAVLR